MSVRLCKGCKAMAERLGILDKVLSLCRARCWMCPRNMEQCGTVNGKTQARLRDEVFLDAIAEMIAEQLAERDSERVN